jgi:hypothetical protein
LRNGVINPYLFFGKEQMRKQEGIKKKRMVAHFPTQGNWNMSHVFLHPLFLNAFLFGEII